MSITLEDSRSLLRTLIRSIDKKVDFSAALNTGDRPGVALTLSLQKHHAKMVISEEQLDGVEDDPIRRAQLRTALKRTIDRMTFKPNDVVSTKMVRASVTDGGFFRIQQGSRTGRR
jgi:hypothetical protein